MFNRFLKISAQASALVIAAFILSHCGQPRNNSSTCTANVVDNMALAVTRLSGTTYQITLCQNMQNPAPYSVWAGSSPSLMQTRNASNLSGAYQAGDVFQVTFLASDTVFAIYYDQTLGGSSYPSNQGTPLVSPHSIPQN